LDFFEDGDGKDTVAARERLNKVVPFQEVLSCWNGMVAMKTEPMLKYGVKTET
jgi:hypothetical protein